MNVLGVNFDFSSIEFSQIIRLGSLTCAIALNPVSIGAQDNYEFKYSQDFYYSADAVEHPSLSLPNILLNQYIEGKINIERRIEELSHLSYDWDGKGALPIEQDVISNVRAIFNSLSPDYCHLWRIFPDTNGTIMLVHRKPHVGSLSIGNSDFSYFAYNKYGNSIAGEHKFSIEGINSTISEIESLFE